MAFLNFAGVQVAVLGLAAWTIGYGLAGARWRFEHPALRTASLAAFGLAIISFSIFLLSLLHAVSAIDLRIFSNGLVLLAVPGLAALLGSLFKPSRNKQPVTFFEGLILFIFFMYAGWMILGAALPALDRDEIIYHLEVPRQMLRGGGTVLFRDNIYGYFPQFGEMFFLLAGGTSGEWAAKLSHVLFGLLLGLAIYGFSRKYLSRIYALLSAALFLTIPSVMVIMPWAYVDLTYSLYAFLALAAVVEYFGSGQGRWALFAGVMAGCASAVKFTGLQFTMLVACLIFVEHVFTRRKGLPLAAVFFVAGAVPFAVPYIWRSWHETGWPFFPFKLEGFELRDIFNWDADRARLYLKWLSSYGTPLGEEAWWHTLLAPVLVFVTARFNSYLFYEGVIGPVFLLTPFLLFKKEKPQPLKGLMFFSLLFLYYWALTTKQVRFLLPVLPVISFLLAYGLSVTRFRLVMNAIVLGLMTASCVMGVQEVLRLYPIPYWLGLETRDQYLARHVEGYRAYQSANRWLGPEDRVYLINMKNYVYYLNCRWRADFIFERFQLDRFMEKNPDPGEVLEFFKSRGITHLLVNESFIASEKWGMPPTQLKIFQDFLSQHAAPLMRDRNYALYRLGNPNP